MFKILMTLSLFISFLIPQELLVVADTNFPVQSLTKEKIKAIFLDKKRFINSQQILVMNYEYNHPLRSCFEENILEKTPRALQKYWRRAYYKGKRPPKVLKSVAMLFSFFETVQPSIGYMDANLSNDRNVTILYSVRCDTK
ncbi:MAG: Unknown protein [uncultured Sulfurovum sp.]|uniref:Uncharacterized protein n=1 Tax=uncultured Sulfurovum sp. TaxID=269237 RepID=A0A6S6UFS8_9BACT|nr:MAG: Unknown protein [uncultured Sulfurovum sp.]